MICLLVALIAAGLTPRCAQANAVDNPAASLESDALAIEFVGVDGILLDNIRRNVRLVARLTDGTRLSVGERRRLQRRAPDEIKRALEPFGYYRVNVSTQFDRIAATLRYAIELNDPVRVKSVDLRMVEEAVEPPARTSSSTHSSPKNPARHIAPPLPSSTQAFTPEFAAWQREFELPPGQQLDHPSYERSKKALLSKALTMGYFDARYIQSTIAIDAQRESAEITLLFSSGARYRIGAVDVNWRYESADMTHSDADNTRRLGIDADLLNSLITLRTKQFYDAENLASTQKNLSDTPFFASVEVTLGELDAQAQRVPVTVTLTPRKRQAYNFELGAGTDTGLRASVGYENRRVNARGHNLSARFGISELSRSVILNYAVPRFKIDSQSLNLFASQTETFSRSRRYDSSEFGAELRREQGALITTYGLAASRERFKRFTREFLQLDRDIDLLIPSVQWTYSQADDLYFPTEGWSALVELRGSSDALVSDINLVQAELDLKKLFPLGNGKLKLRLSLGASIISDATDLPESLGFLTGGDDSVRGYAFESIGVDRLGQTQVAKHAMVAGIEYQHPLRNGLALAAFVDSGDAFNSSPDFNTGVGLGLRWRLPFGALRLDLASALDLDGDPVRLHFSFGGDL